MNYGPAIRTVHAFIKHGVQVDPKHNWQLSGKRLKRLRLIKNGCRVLWAGMILAFCIYIVLTMFGNG